MRAILNYEDTGNKGICGQTVGADGRVEFCIIYTGDEAEIHRACKELLGKLSKSRRLGKWIMVYDQETYSGNSVMEIDV